MRIETKYRRMLTNRSFRPIGSWHELELWAYVREHLRQIEWAFLFGERPVRMIP